MPLFTRSVLGKVATPLVLILAASFIVWGHLRRIDTLSVLAEIPNWSVDAARPDQASQTGYNNGVRKMIFPESNIESKQWIQQAQIALVHGTTRITKVDYDNAPKGRTTQLPWIYRALFISVSRVHHAMTGEPLGLSAERVALYIDPLLQASTVILTFVFVTFEFGPWAAALTAVGMCILFPFNAAYVAGLPERYGLALSSVFFVLLPLVAALRRMTRPGAATESARPENDTRISGRNAVMAGLYFCLSLTASTVGQAADPVALLPVHIGLTTVGIMLAVWRRRWPLFGGLIAVSNGLLAACSLRAGFRIFYEDLLASRLTALDGGIVAPNLIAWIVRDGLSPRAIATLLPLSLLGLMGWALWKAYQETSDTSSAFGAWLILLVIAPALSTLVFASFELRIWSAFQACLISGLAVVVGCHRRPSMSGAKLDAKLSGKGGGLLTANGLALAAIILSLPGALVAFPRGSGSAAESIISEANFRRLLARDLGYWIRQREPRAVVLAPPELTASLSFYGGFHGVCTLDKDNREGIDAAIRICSATTAEEALRLIQARGITHLVIPSWDDFLATSVKLGSVSARRPFVAQVLAWQLPNWFRPTVYFLPEMSGSINTEVVVFEVVSEQDAAASLGALTEFFVETGHLSATENLRAKLGRLPTDPVALIALAEIEHAMRDDSSIRLTLKTLSQILSGEAGADLLPDRRAVAAVLLAQNGDDILSRGLAARAAEELTDADLKSLPPRQLLRFLALLKQYRIQITDPTVRQNARLYLPPASRGAVE